MDRTMAGNQATRLTRITCVVEQGATIGMAELPPRRPQDRLGSGHIPILRGAAAGEGDVKIALATQDRGDLAANAAHATPFRQGQRRQQLLEALIAVVAAGHEHQLRGAGSVAEPHGPPLAVPALAPGFASLARASQEAQPKLFRFRQQHHAQHRTLPPYQGQMHGVLARALQKIAGAIQGIEDPQPVPA